MLKNPLDTELAREKEGWKIGDWDPDTKEVYSGPKYGMKSREEYNELLKSGALGRGQQAVELTGQQLVETGKNIADKVGEVIPDVDFQPSPRMQQAAGLVKKFSGEAWELSGLGTTLQRTMQVIDAPATGISWVSRKLDPTGRGIGKAPLQVAEAALPAVGAAKTLGQKGLKYSDKILSAATLNKRLQPAYATATVGDDLIRGTTTAIDTATDFKPNTVFAATGSTKSTRTVLDKTFTNEADRRFNRVEHMQTKTINTFKKKAGNQFDSLSKKLDSSYEHYEKTGNLKGMEGGSKWTNEETGEVFLIKNKAAANERVKLGVDSLESVTATKALRDASAKITVDDVIKVAKETGIDEATAVKYFNEASKGKRDLTKLIYGLNKEAGKKLWSLGHGRAVKALRDQGSGFADMLSNIELEPLMNVVDEFGEVIVRGNSGRGAVDELPNALNTALNRSRNLREELIKYSDKDLGEFWPKMGPITDEASFLRESAKRDAFVEKVLEINKKTKDIKVAIDEVLTASGMMKGKIRKPSEFLDASVYKNLKIVLD